MIYQNKNLYVTLFFVICCIWLYMLMTFGSFQSGDNSTHLVKQESRREKQNSWLDNSIPIGRTYSPSSFVARAKRQAKESPEKNSGLLPTTEITKSSQQIQFTPTLGSFYGSPDSINSFQLTAGQPFPPPNYMQLSNAAMLPFLPAFLPFQQQQQQPMIQMPFNLNGAPAMQQPMFFLSQGNLPQHAAALYCSHIPALPTYQFPEVPGIADYNQMVKMGVDERSEVVGADFSNPYRELLADYTRECPPNHYRCADGSKCVSKLQWCDNHVDCQDASDETKCSCRERIGRERLCDNYPDCPHGEDELGCYGCPKNKISCNDSGDFDSNECTSLEERCDGTSQCSSGKDEESCNILTESFASSNEMFPVGYSSGFLRRNLRGKWYPVCGYADTWAKEACVSEVGFQSEEPTLEMIPTPYNVGPFLTPDGLSHKIVDECPTQMTYVRCPIVPSGIRILGNSTSSDSILGSPKAPSSSSDAVLGIVGGHDSQPRAWPFVVAINRNGRFHCGGAILNEWWIISAAHCFPDYQRYYYEIEAGMLRRSSYSPAHQSRRFVVIIIHENYDPMILRNDIALCLLDEPLAFNGWVRPVQLPKQDSGFYSRMQQPSPGDMCVAVGWGATREGGPDPDHLREVEMPIVNCRHLEDKNRAEICAGFLQGGRDACQGDSGGPLMCRVSTSSNAEWYIGGIVSHGIGCGRRNEPGAYTKVSYFVNWIRSVTNSRQAPSSLSRPRATCPGFLCNRPYAKCLPRESHCDRVADCLEAEDEWNCPNFGQPIESSERSLEKSSRRETVSQTSARPPGRK